MARTAGFEGERWNNPRCSDPDHPERCVGLIGCGNFGYSAIAYYVRKRSRRFLRGAYDPSRAQSRSLCNDYRGAYAAGDARQIIEDPAIRLVYIASNHASHADYAVDCIRAGKDVHIEKPHVVSAAQLDALMQAQKDHPERKVFLGFNRPRSPHARRIFEALDSQTGTTMINWFIAGHAIDDAHWYFDEKEGGRVLGNLCHWTDFTLRMVGMAHAFPCEVVPVAHVGAKSDFAVGMKFADGSVAGITFSAKGHTFEGVREVLQAHKGDVLLSVRDFGETEIEVVDKRRKHKTRGRSHGHGENITNSYDGSITGAPGCAEDPAYVAATAYVFLAVKDAIDNQRRVLVTANGFEPADSNHGSGIAVALA